MSYLERLILHVLQAGERLVCEKSYSRVSRSGTPFSVSAVHVSPGVEIWKSCRFSWGMSCVLLW